MIKSVKQAFDENGISIPFPQVAYNARLPGLAAADAAAEREDPKRITRDGRRPRQSDSSVAEVSPPSPSPLLA